MPKRAVALLALELGSATAERIILGWQKCNALQGDEVQLDGSPLRQERRGLLLPFQRRGRPGPLAQCTAVEFSCDQYQRCSHYQQTAWDGDGGQ